MSTLLTVLTQHRPQQYGYEILVLWSAKKVSEQSQIVAQMLVQTYDWQTHSSPRDMIVFANHLVPQSGLCGSYFIVNVLFLVMAPFSQKVQT